MVPDFFRQAELESRNQQLLAAFDRLYEVTTSSTPADLALALQVSESAVVDAQRKGVLPGVWLLRLLLVWHISPAWIISGEGKKRALGLDHHTLDEVSGLLDLVQ